MVVCVDHGGDCVFDVLPVVWAAFGAVRWLGLAFAGNFRAQDIGFKPPWVTWRQDWSDGSVIGCKSLIFSGLGGDGRRLPGRMEALGRRKWMWRWPV